MLLGLCKLQKGIEDCIRLHWTILPNNLLAYWHTIIFIGEEEMA